MKKPVSRCILLIAQTLGEIKLREVRPKLEIFNTLREVLFRRS